MAEQHTHRWLEYFNLLHDYEKDGYLEVMPEKNEGYITQPALCAMTPGDDPREQAESGELLNTAVRIRAYAAWRSQEGSKYFSVPFALHVVQPEAPHDLICTVLITQRRQWWRPWHKSEYVEVIAYGK